MFDSKKIQDLHINMTYINLKYSHVNDEIGEGVTFSKFIVVWNEIYLDIVPVMR